MKTRKVNTDYLKSVKKVDRENEIATHGKLISTRPTRVAQNKKIYNRKRLKLNLF